MQVIVLDDGTRYIGLHPVYLQDLDVNISLFGYDGVMTSPECRVTW